MKSNDIDLIAIILLAIGGGAALVILLYHHTVAREVKMVICVFIALINVTLVNCHLIQILCYGESTQCALSSLSSLLKIDKTLYYPYNKSTSINTSTFSSDGISGH